MRLSGVSHRPGLAPRVPDEFESLRSGMTGFVWETTDHVTPRQGSMG